jgi:iron complex outermembrane receptor protein
LECWHKKYFVWGEYKMGNRISALAVVLIASMCAVVAKGESALSDATATPGDRSAVLSEIVVTARKRTETAQSVPLALTALDEKALEQHHVVTIDDLQSLSPNLSIHPALGGDTDAVIYLRGFGTSTNDPALQPPVAVNIDGIYQATLAGSIVDLFDLERVEVLRGPQNTLGKNAPVGSINFYTKRPTGDWDFTGQLDEGRFESHQIRAAVDFPIMQGILAGRLSATALDGGNYIRNVSFPGRGDSGGQSGTGVRAGLLFTPTNDIEWYVTANWVRNYSSIQANRNISSTAPLPLLASAIAPAPSISCGVFGYCNAYPVPNTTGSRLFGDVDDHTVSITSNFVWRFDPFTLTALTGYKHIYTNDPVSVDALPICLYCGTQVIVNSRELSQEIRLNSHSEGFLTFNDRFDWLVGGYFFRQNYSGNRAFALAGSAAEPDGAVNISDRQFGVSKSTAGFAHGIFKITPDWNVSAGARYTVDRLSHGDYGNDIPGTSPQDPDPQQAKFSNTSKEVGTEYRLSRDQIVFARYAEGYASGGYNGIPPTAGLPPFKPETVKSYEVGVKTEWFTNRLRANANIFTSKYNDLQKFVSELAPSGNTFLLTKNAATATVKGAELELTALPIPRFETGLSVGYIDAKYTNFTADVTGTGIQRDLTGQRFPWTPKVTASINAGYDVYVDSSIGTVRATADFDYRTSAAVNSIDTYITDQGGYGLLNASLKWQDAAGKYSVTAYGKNVLNKHYYLALEPAAGLATLAMDGPPATWGVSLAAKF